MIEEHIEINGYFAHPENLLLSMLGTAQQPQTYFHTYNFACQQQLDISNNENIRLMSKTIT